MSMHTTEDGWDVSELDAQRVTIPVEIVKGRKPLVVSYNPLGITLEGFGKLNSISGEGGDGFDAVAVAESLILMELDWKLYRDGEKVPCTLENILGMHWTVAIAISKAVREYENPNEETSPNSSAS